MIKLEINCRFERRQQSTGTQQERCGKKEVLLGGRQGREFKKKEDAEEEEMYN